ncbi:MAG TPA: SDR family NAD(P)-dependent oxidoreductase, partial [Ardenticatenaceae bacterium]
MPTYLVTGGAGFIGSNLVEALLERGITVRVLDNLSTGRRSNVQHLMNDIEFIEGDIRSMETVSAAARGVEVVFHEAALVSVPASVEDPVLANEMNVTGTLNVLVAARDAGARRVVLASSAAIYGDNPVLPKVETMLPEPLSPYAVSKLADEHYCEAFTKLYGLPTIALRYFNVFGPRQDPASPYSAVIPIFLSRMARGEPPTLRGDGLQTRDFVYVSDVVQANLLAAEA